MLTMMVQRVHANTPYTFRDPFSVGYYEETPAVDINLKAQCTTQVTAFDAIE